MRARNNQFCVNVEGVKPKTFVIVIETVKASFIKDAMSLAVITAVSLFMMMMGLSMGFTLAVFSIFTGIFLLPRFIGETSGVHRLPPEAALEFIEQELAEAVAEAKEKGDWL